MGEISGPILTVCEPKFPKFSDDVGDLRTFQRRCPIVYVTFRSKDIAEVVEKRNKCKSFLAPIFWEGSTPTFLRQIVSAIYYPPFGKAWLSSVC